MDHNLIWLRLIDVYQLMHECRESNHALLQRLNRSADYLEILLGLRQVVVRIGTDVGLP